MWPEPKPYRWAFVSMGPCVCLGQGVEGLTIWVLALDSVTTLLTPEPGFR